MIHKTAAPCSLLLCLLLAAPTLVWAGPLDIYGAGSRGAAMGAQTATSDGPAAVYYNLGALSRVEAGLSIGAFATFNNAQILLQDRPSGYDIPDMGPNSPARPSSQTPNPRRDTESIGPLYALTFGGVTSFGLERLRGGFLVVLPTNELLNLGTHFVDERERHFSNQLHFELIDRRVHRMHIDLGLSYHLTDWVSFGIGGTYLPGANVQTDVYVPDPTNQSNVDINADVDTANSWGLLAGALFDLPHGLQFGITYRQSIAFRIQGQNDLQIRGLDTGDDEIFQPIDWVPMYSPSIFAFGLAAPIDSVLLAYDLRYTLWSDYRDTQSARPEFRDRLSHRLGAEYDYSAETLLRVGLGYEPSPVPDQVGRTNYVDNDRILGSFGASHHFQWLTVPMEAAWFFQFQYLIARVATKEMLDAHPSCTATESRLCDEIPDDYRDPRTGESFPEAQGLQTANPGFPGYTSGGWIGAVGLELRY